MTRFERIKMVLKYLRGTAQLCVCYGLGKICVKLNSSAKPRALCRGMIRGIEDVMDASKALGLNEQYEEFKRVYDEIV